MIKMLRVTTPDQIKTVATLAHKVWNQYYVPMIGQAQVDYMLAKLQSVQAIAQQMTEGAEYYLVTDTESPAGYVAIIPDLIAHRALLSKLYVMQERRGTGLGKEIMIFIEKRCADLGIRELWLTVNRNNSDSMAFYQHMGFTVTRNLVQDIGNGFVMDDYQMAKTIGATAAEG